CFHACYCPPLCLPSFPTRRSSDLSGYDFDAPNGFSISGSLDLGGSFGTCEDTCALQITFGHVTPPNRPPVVQEHGANVSGHEGRDRKSTRLNSSHVSISYAVFCLK